MTSWLPSLDPSLLHHLADQGIPPQLVEEKCRQTFNPTLAYRHRLTDHTDEIPLRLHIRIDAEA